MANNETTIVTKASQGVGAAVVRAFLDGGYNVVGSACSFSGENFAPSPNLVLIEGGIGLATTGEKTARTANEKFGSNDHAVSSAGIASGVVDASLRNRTSTDFMKTLSPSGEARQESDVPTGLERWPAMNRNNKPAVKPSATEQSWTGLSCPECEERSYLRMLVAELLHRNQVLRFDLTEARNQVERMARLGSDWQGDDCGH
jgi:hypothetical protein